MQLLLNQMCTEYKMAGLGWPKFWLSAALTFEAVFAKETETSL